MTTDNDKEFPTAPSDGRRADSGGTSPGLFDVIVPNVLGHISTAVVADIFANVVREGYATPKEICDHFKSQIPDGDKSETIAQLGGLYVLNMMMGQNKNEGS
ncbi:MAG: hypothetical protein MPK30_04690 [Gammaproteobacteria bacterium]|nr:hypothetical protein [Gammaproteobacteria bacterium]